MNAPLACTIIANNYLAYARAFTHSFLERHPEGKVEVLIVDRPQPGHRYEDEPFAVTFADQLGIPGFAHFSFRYSIVELSTAVKPWFLLHLHRTLGVERACYFDPDILVFGDLGELYDLLKSADAVLTPHLTAPLDDERVPGEREILLSGIYNLGFLGLAFNERTLAFLGWWKERLYRWCLHEVDKGLFVDQRWMDLAPAFLPRTEILRDPGYNVAYWNLSHRTLTRHGSSWWVGDVPLRFFHFSGYDFNRPDSISKFQNRYSFAERPDVLPLFELYGESIRRQGQKEVQDYPYGYGRFANGVAIPDLARRVLRQLDPDGVRWPNPFAISGPDSFFDWLRRPVDRDESVPLPRLALLLWDHREDLKLFFPRPWNEDRPGFAQWIVQAGPREGIDPAFTAGLEGRLRWEDTPGEQALDHLASLVRTPAGEGEYGAPEITWLTADAGHDPSRRPRVPRLALEIHRRRADLLRAYPDPLGADRKSLALWFVTYGRHEYRLPKPVVTPVLRSLSWRQQAWARLWWERQKRRERTLITPALVSRPLPPPSPGEKGEKPFAQPVAHAAGPAGFNVIGWSASPTGVGEACRGTLAALELAGLGAALWPLDEGAPGLPGMANDGLPYEVSLYHVNADMMETIHSRLPRGFTAGRHRIGYWFWELAHFPVAFAGAFHHTDEVWAPSRFCQQAFQSLATVEVRWVPPCVVPTAAVPASRESLGIDPGSFLFFFAFDALSVPERKNPAGLLAAFTQVARESRRPVHLLMKANHAESEPGFIADLQRRSAGLPVTLLTGTLSRGQLDGLTAACDAYVSLHRSEGLGLPLIEAMYLGKPVIATGYGGVTDFLDEETGFVVRHGMTALERPQGPYPKGAVWAEPDAGHAASLMLALAATPELAAPKVAAARRRVTELYAPEAAARRFRCELERIRQSQESPVAEGLSLRTAGRVLRAEGLPALRDRLSDRWRERHRRLSFVAAGSPLGLPANPVLNLLSTAPTPRLGGLQAQLLHRIESEAGRRPLALLYPGDGAWRLEVAAAGRRLSLTLDTLDGNEPPSPVALADAAFERAVLRAVREVGARALHLEGLAALPLASLLTLHGQGLELVLSVHDFSLFCPRPHLLESPELRFCNYSCDGGRCARCLEADWPVPPGFQQKRRALARELLLAAAAVVYPSDFLRRRHLELFPGIPPERQRVVEPPGPQVVEPPPAGSGMPVRHVAYIGQVLPHKGALVFEEVVRRMAGGFPDLRWSAYGGGDPELLLRLRRLPRVRVRGYYRSGSLIDHLRRDRVDLALLLSIVPESYSLALSECLAAGVPVAAFDHGAIAERLRRHGGGLLVEPEAGAAGIAAAVAARINGLRIPGETRTDGSLPAGSAAQAFADLYRELGLC